MVKYLFSDIDGTLLQNNSLDKITIQKINDFVKNGNKFYCVTGRTDEHIKTIENAIGVFGDYRISQNGCVIYDKNNNLIYKNIMDIKIAKDIAEYLYPIVDKYNITFGVSELSGKRYYKSGKDNIDINFKDRIGVDIFPVLFLLISDNEDNFELIRKYIDDNYGDLLSCVLTTFGVMEILQKSASKANGIALILEKENIPIKDVYVVGDNENDICMFKKYKNSFCMIEAKENIKSYANNCVSEVGDLIDYINYPMFFSYKVSKMQIKLKNKCFFINKNNTLVVNSNNINSIDISDKYFKDNLIDLVNQGADKILFNTENEIFLIKEDLKSLISYVKKINPSIILLIESKDIETSNNYANIGFDGVILLEEDFLKIQESLHLINCPIGVYARDKKVNTEELNNFLQMNAWFFVFSDQYYKYNCDNLLKLQLSLRLEVVFNKS